MTTPEIQLGRVTVLFGEKNGKYPDGNQVIVQGRDAKAIFDTPLSAHRFSDRLAGADMVVLGHVHEDHACGLPLLPEVEVFAPQADLKALQSLDGLMAHYSYAPATERKMRKMVVEDFHFQPRPEAKGYSDGAVWDLGGTRVRAIHMPGHTGGHSVLLVEPEGVAFIGDIDLTGFGPYYGDACSNLREFKETLLRLEQLEAKAWVTFHHKGVITERATFLSLLRAFTDKIHEREEAMLAFMGDAGSSVEQMVAHRFLFPRGYEGIFVEDAERMTVREHLALLLEQGRIVEDGGRYRLRAAG
ncbi:MAG: MBL fold metallo-hydrolase [bacterium]